MSDVLGQWGASGKYILIESMVAGCTYINVLEEGEQVEEQLVLAVRDASDPTAITNITINSDGTITIEDPTTEESTTE
jgi:hypothetical protein